MQHRFVENGDQLVLGEVLDRRQVEALSRISVSGEQVLENLEGLNEELEESHETEREAAPQVARQGSPVARPTGRDLRRQEPPKQETRSRLQSKQEETRVKMNESLDLDSELDALADAAQEAQAPAQAPDIKDEILKLLAKTPGAPSKAQIEQLKAQHGQAGVYCLALGEGDVYIFTHLKRGQWQKIQEVMGKIQASAAGQAQNLEEQLKEKVIANCVLWPKPLPIEFLYNSRAGVVDRIYDAILMNSYFLSPQQTLYLTTTL